MKNYFKDWSQSRYTTEKGKHYTKKELKEKEFSSISINEIVLNIQIGNKNIGI